jgi:hypothetical protein
VAGREIACHIRSESVASASNPHGG